MKFFILFDVVTLLEVKFRERLLMDIFHQLVIPRVLMLKFSLSVSLSRGRPHNPWALHQAFSRSFILLAVMRMDGETGRPRRPSHIWKCKFRQNFYTPNKVHTESRMNVVSVLSCWKQNRWHDPLRADIHSPNCKKKTSGRRKNSVLRNVRAELVSAGIVEVAAVHIFFRHSHLCLGSLQDMTL